MPADQPNHHPGGQGRPRTNLRGKGGEDDPALPVGTASGTPALPVGTTGGDVYSTGRRADFACPDAGRSG